MQRIIDRFITRHLPDDPLERHHARTMLVIMYTGLLFICVALFSDVLRFGSPGFNVINMIGNIAIFVTLVICINLIMRQQLSAALWLFIPVFVGTIAADLVTRGADDPGTLLLFVIPIIVGATLLRRRELLIIFLLMTTILIVVVIVQEDTEQRRVIGNFAILSALIVALLDQLLAGYRAVIDQLETHTAALENEIRQRESAQRESARLTNILENTSDFVAVTNPAKLLVYLNRGGRELLDLDPENSISGVGVRTIFPDWALDVFKNERLPVHFRDGVWQGDVTLKVPGKGEIPVSQVITAEYDDAGKIAFLATICRDMRERHNAENARLKLALQTERLTALREMVDTVTHDIKSPLSSILTNLYMAQKLVDDPLRQQTQLDRIREQIRNIETMIQDVLTISKMDVAPETTRIPIDLVTLLQRIQRDLGEQMQQKKIMFKFNVLGDLPRVSANPNEIPRVFINLIENALKYTQPTGEIRVRIYADRTNEGVRVEVHDNGPGIPPDDLPYIFDRFYRARNVINVSGTGLGLAIVKKTVETHNGTVEIESEPGKGTLVRVWLPVKTEVSV